MTAYQSCPICSGSVAASALACATCGTPLDPAASSQAEVTDTGALRSGTTLNGGEFSIGRVLGSGGFGITYLGAELTLRRAVAIKEFFPAGTVRQGTTAIPPRTMSPADFTSAKEKFL